MAISRHPNVGIAAAITILASLSELATAHNTTVCQSLAAAGFQAQVYFPGDDNYAAREASYWSASAALHPACIIQPRNTIEVSHALVLIANSGQNFAVRSGGHTQWAGGNDVHEGVTIDLGLMNTTTYDPQTTLASLLPGARWGDVYTTLVAQGVVVAGGREASVGVGGFLTGGGISYYSGLMGMSCDSVVNYEIVLANGSIVNANNDTNSDLWKGLKGGSGNYGIVTRFDMQAIPTTNLWGGLRLYDKSVQNQVISATVNFTSNNVNSPEAASGINFAYAPAMSSDIIVAAVLVDTKGIVNASAFDEFLAIPSSQQTTQVQTITQLAASNVLPQGFRNVWFTLNFANDARIMTKAVELQTALVAELKTLIPPDNFTIQCLLEPLPAFFAQHSLDHGGNVLGLDTLNKDGIVWLGTAMVSTVEQQAIVQPRMAGWAATLQAYAESVGGNQPLRYLNYADGTQDPLRSYGSANVEFIAKVAAEYDPKGVFQKQVPGGFKVSRI